jgi:sugar-specific transcriptional regulator TrmB
MQLQELGLQPIEAQVYQALVRNGAQAGNAIARIIRFPRSSVYLALNSLLDKGLIEGGTGHGSRFSIVSPDKALPSFIAQETEAITAAMADREKLAVQLGLKLGSLVEPNADIAPDDLIQVIRNPRAVADRYDRLRLEAQRSIETFTKAPIFSRPGPDRVLEQALRRGVRCRNVDEREVLNHPAIEPYIAKWLAKGEESRVFNGKLPHKLALFDRQSAFVALSLPGDQMRTVFIRHPELANSLGILFDTFWDRSQPLTIEDEKGTGGNAISIRKRSDNGQASGARK